MLYHIIADVLIIQESDKPVPDDNVTGGTLTFTFNKPVLFADIGLMDIANTQLQRIIFTYEGGGVETFTYKPVGSDNAVQRVIANKRNVRKVDVYASSSMAVVELNFCPSC